MIVYKVTNVKNGRTYVGQTRNSLRCRKRSHLYASRQDSQFLLHKALRKYGLKYFLWEVIDTANNLDELNHLESEHIRKTNSFVRVGGYNLTTGGDNCEISEETKQRMRDSAVKNMTDKKRLAISNRLKKYFEENGVSEETRRKIKENRTVEHITDKHKQQISDANSGENNPMFGTTPYDLWLNEYGIEEANNRYNSMCDNIRASKYGEDNPFFGKTHTEKSMTQKRCTIKRTPPEVRIEHYKNWYRGRFKKEAPQSNLDRKLIQYQNEYAEVNQ